MMIEGGPRAHAAFVAAGLFDELQLFLAPSLLGGEARSWLGALGIERLAEAPELRLERVERVDRDLLVVCRPHGRRN